MGIVGSLIGDFWPVIAAAALALFGYLRGRSDGANKVKREIAEDENRIHRREEEIESDVENTQNDVIRDELGIPR